MIISDENSVRGDVVNVIEEVVKRDVTAAVVAFSMADWESGYEREYGWGEGAKLFIMYRCNPSPEEQQALDENGAMGMKTALHEVGLPEGAQTKYGPSIEHVVRMTAKGLREHPDDDNSCSPWHIVSPSGNTWDYCAVLTVMEAWTDRAQRDNARVVISVDRAKYRYVLCRPEGNDDDERLLVVEFHPVRHGDDLDGLGDALNELMDAVPGEEIPM